MNHDLNVLLVRMEKVRGLGFISLVIKNREMTKTPFDFWFSRKDLQDWLLHACSAHNNEAFYYTNFESRLAVRLENRSGEDDNNIAVFELFIYKTFSENYVMYSFRIDAPTLLKFLESPDTLCVFFIILMPRSQESYAPMLKARFSPLRSSVVL